MSKVTINSLAHTSWNCKYHIVFAPKYRRKVFYGEKRLEIGAILRSWYEWKEVEIFVWEVCPDHIQILIKMQNVIKKIYRIKKLCKFIKKYVIMSLRRKIMKIIEVVAAIIFDKDKIFATQRGYGEFKDWWEFPGGKIEKGESNQQALKREIKEELDIDITIEDFITTIEYDYPSFHLTMHCFKCSLINGYPKLLEHEDSKWVDKKNIGDLKWLPADLSLIDILKEML